MNFQAAAPLSKSSILSGAIELWAKVAATPGKRRLQESKADEITLCATTNQYSPSAADISIKVPL
jgi:hypothetical protein